MDAIMSTRNKTPVKQIVQPLGIPLSTSVPGDENLAGMDLEPIDREFYGDSAVEVAPRLLGHWLIRRGPLGPMGGPIVEAEAYLENDPACHAFAGNTRRNRSMWGPPGISYVYFIYGMHYCFNAVCLPPGRAEAVLIRAIEAELNPELMRRFRPSSSTVSLTNGPAKLCQALNITKGQDGADLCQPSSDLFIAMNPDLKGFRSRRGPVAAVPRIGISVAAAARLRFVLSGSPFLSVKP